MNSTTWEPPKTKAKGIVVPEEIRARMVEGDDLLWHMEGGKVTWRLNGVEQPGLFDHSGNASAS
jgi:hypothetical protein